MSQIDFRPLSSILLLMYIVFLQGDVLGLKNLLKNKPLQYFQRNIPQTEHRVSPVKSNCTLESLKNNGQCVGLPFGKRVFPLPGKETFILPQVPVNLNESGRRIIGGKPIPITKFPFIVSVQFNNKHSCGGSYIRERWVLTAAHCLVADERDSPLKNPSAYTSVMGSAVLDGTPNDLKDMQVRRVLFTYVNANYSRAVKLDDIGLMKLVSAFHMTTGISLAKLPKNANDGEYRDHTICSVLGWGTTNETLSIASPILLSTEIPLITITRCQTFYGVERILPRKLLCAGLTEGGKDACQGDSGGPLICNGMELGIVSWGKECGHKNQPGVYTRVDYYLKWINNTIEQSIAEERFNMDWLRNYRSAYSTSPPFVYSSSVICITLISYNCII